MGRIARSTIQEVHERLDAVAVVEDYLRLERRGGRYWGRCPFHSGGRERTPSMTVDPDKKLYYCFGCSKGGGIVDFVMEMDKTDYPETIRSLARKFGVQIVHEESSPGEDAEREAEYSRREQLFELYRRVAVTFAHFLLEKPEGKPALDYLLSRGAEAGEIRRFRLGYSPGDRNWLYGFLQGKGYSRDFLDGSGLFSANYRGMSFFSGRLMFPISDRQGRTVAFGGRALPGAAQSDGKEPPKYVNSRETEAYKKGQILYGLDLALPEIRRSKTVYVVEGYMDVIAMHRAGLSNSVAPCGTAFTDEQARLLRSWADSAVLVFDSDAAGLKAADKGIVTCRRNGLACSLVAPGKSESGEEMKDPADILQKFGAETLNKVMRNVIVDFEYLIARGKTLHDTSIPQGKAEAFASLYPYLDALSSRTERDACIEAAADALRADREAAKADYGRRQPSGSPGEGSEGDPEVAGGDRREDEAIRPNNELLLLTLVAVNVGLYAGFRSLVGMREIEDPAAKELFVALEECFANDESGVEALLSRISWGRLREFVARKAASNEFGFRDDGAADPDRVFDPAKMMKDGISRIKVRNLERRVSEIVSELRFIERNPDARDGGDVEDLIAEKMRMDAEIRKLEGK